MASYGIGMAFLISTSCLALLGEYNLIKGFRKASGKSKIVRVFLMLICTIPIIWLIMGTYDLIWGFPHN